MASTLHLDALTLVTRTPLPSNSVMTQDNEYYNHAPYEDDSDGRSKRRQNLTYGMADQNEDNDIGYYRQWNRQGAHEQECSAQANVFSFHIHSLLSRYTRSLSFLWVSPAGTEIAKMGGT